MATFTGWNLRHRGIGAENQLLRLVGARIPFARTAAERKKRGDPRRAVLERYQSYDDYLRKYTAAARKMIDERFLLEEDLELTLTWARRNRGLFETTAGKE